MQSRKKLSARSRRRRIWLLVLVGVVVLAAAVAAVLVGLSAQSTPDVVPYPTVTGVLGDHLEELQKSVEP
jgi:flagellar basal body-associated protein FliL